MLAKIDFVFGKPVDAVLVPDDANRVESAVCPTRSVFQTPTCHPRWGRAKPRPCEYQRQFPQVRSRSRHMRALPLPSQQENVLLVTRNWHLSRSIAQSACSHFSKTFVR